MKVMVVEDDADVRELVRLALPSEGGFAVDEYGTAAEALAAVESARPDLVLLDVMMPDVDGVSLAHALRASAATRSVAIVFMTACLRPGDIAGYAALGALDVIAKPFDPSKLAQRLRAAAREGAPAGEGDEASAASRNSMGRGYRSELEDRVRDIERALARAVALTAVEAGRAAVLAHRLAGSAAAFGLDEVSSAARALEDALGRFLIEDNEQFHRALAQRVDALRRCVVAESVPA
jgi:DNA-binding response OmpR family regulator